MRSRRFWQRGTRFVRAAGTPAIGLVLMSFGLLLLSAHGGAARAGEPTGRLYAALASSIVRIETQYGMSIFLPRGAGSAVVIGGKGLLVTADHVIAEASEIWIVDPDGVRQRASVVRRLPRRDLALLRVENPRPLQPLSPQTTAAAQPGECVTAVGNVMGRTIGIFAGVVAATCCDDCAAGDTDQILTDITAPPGLSGGALIECATGSLLGIVSFGILALDSRAATAGIVGAVPAKYLAQLLQEDQTAR